MRPHAFGAALLALLPVAMDARAQAAADAEPPVPDARAARIERMREEMHVYFAGEASGSWGFGGAGVVSLTGAALGLFAAKDDIYKGAAYPFVAVGLIQLGAGIVLGLRTHGQVVERDALLGQGDGRAFWALETPRMERVQWQFRLLQVVELGLAVVGVGLAAYGGAERDRVVTGVGLGVAVEAGSMLVLDHMASVRADRYADALRAFSGR